MKNNLRAARALWPLTGVLACACAGAWAQDEEVTDTLQWRVSAGVEHDSNVLRASAAASDDIGVLAAGVRLDKRYSLQRLTLDAQVATYRFREFSQLDYRTFNYTGAWNFQFTPRVQGTLSAERRQYRDITDASTGAAEVARRTERHDLAEAAWLFGGGWRALGGVSRDSSRSDDPRSLESSPTVNSARLGAGYEFASGTLLTAQWRRGEGSYGNTLAPDFRETEPFVTLRWPGTARTTLDARVGRVSRKHDTDGERNFDGLVGNANVNWVYSPKTQVSFGFARDLGSYEVAGGGEVRGWRVFIEPVWKPTEKTSVRLRHSRETRQWRTVSAAAPDAGRDDRTRWSALTLEWSPRRPVLLSAAVRSERRSSNLAAHDFRATIYALAARLSF